MRQGSILKELKKRFTLLKVDFYSDGESIETFVFRAEEVTEEQAEKLWTEYDALYSADEYDGAFEDFLKDAGVNYTTLGGNE
jgi:hypothetical protein